MTEKILQDKVAVVTGGGNGIGAEISKLYGELGAKVVVNDLGVAVDGSGGEASIAEGVVNEIKAAGGEAVANTQSVATPEGGESIIQDALDNYGKLDIVVHVAGILRDRMLFNMSIDEWDAVINVHLRGAFCVIRPAAALMRAQKSGSIISFSSVRQPVIPVRRITRQPKPGFWASPVQGLAIWPNTASAAMPSGRLPPPV